MTDNRDIDAAQRYHDLTKHSYWSVRSSPHYLDWANKPAPFKIYPNLQPIPLPRSLVQTLAPALEVVAARGLPFEGEKKVDIARLAGILYYSGGVTKHKTYPGGELYFRAAACAGALYPTEVYIVCGAIDGLTAGVYHFNPGDFALRRLREGDFRQALARASASEPSVVSAPVTLVFSSITWRSTWKYRDRAYRYHYWDNGMIAANVLAMAAANELPARIVMSFVEADVNKIIGIDGHTELALSFISLGHSDVQAPQCVDISQLEDINNDVVPLSESQVDYPSIQEAHSASSLSNYVEVREWREGHVPTNQPDSSGGESRLAPIPIGAMTAEPIEDVIQRRASTRRFARKPMPFADLSTILDRATRGIAADFSSPVTDIYAIVNRVEGLEPGGYYFRAEAKKLESLNSGDFSAKAAYLTLDQELGGDASVTFFIMADLKQLLAAYGNRGYRVAQMEAGVTGGKIYLASYALNRGATGLTFYDDDVTNFFSPHARGKSCMLVMSVGLPGKRPVY